MEYRAFLKIPGLDLENEMAWEPFIVWLEREYAGLGPVIGWVDGSAEIVISMDCATEADAARRGMDAVTSALRAVGREELYPASVEVEPVRDDELATT